MSLSLAKAFQEFSRRSVETSRRRELLSFKHHREVAALPAKVMISMVGEVSEVSDFSSARDFPSLACAPLAIQVVKL